MVSQSSTKRAPRSRPFLFHYLQEILQLKNVKVSSCLERDSILEVRSNGIRGEIGKVPVGGTRHSTGARCESQKWRKPR
jgi:hypothetical protein